MGVGLNAPIVPQHRCESNQIQSLSGWRYKLTKFKRTRSLEISRSVIAHVNTTQARRRVVKVGIVGKYRTLLLLDRPGRNN